MVDTAEMFGINNILSSTQTGESYEKTVISFTSSYLL
jgi:hypothetical protein